jgi:hypothetical protein
VGLRPDRAKIASWQSGVFEAKPANAELLAFTLDKTSGGFSPTTRYRDYAVSRSLIHWESQSATRADSATGLRYRHHEREGRTILLFARGRADDRAFWFLGPARYVSHAGEKPMAITWELDVPLPGDLYITTLRGLEPEATPALTARSGAGRGDDGKPARDRGAPSDARPPGAGCRATTTLGRTCSWHTRTWRARLR